jgi:hypothetical protein
MGVLLRVEAKAVGILKAQREKFTNAQSSGSVDAGSYNRNLALKIRPLVQFPYIFRPRELQLVTAHCLRRTFPSVRRRYSTLPKEYSPFHGTATSDAVIALIMLSETLAYSPGGSTS